MSTLTVFFWVGGRLMKLIFLSFPPKYPKIAKLPECLAHKNQKRGNFPKKICIFPYNSQRSQKPLIAEHNLEHFRWMVLLI